MKKLAVLGMLLGLFLGLSVSAQAEGIETGANMVSGYIGVSSPLQDFGMKYENGTSIDWGDVGGSFGVSYISFINEHFGMGLEISGAAFSETEYNFYGYNTYENVKTSMSLLNVMATARLNINHPSNRVRVYIPFGLGITSANGKIKLKGYNFGDSYKGEITGDTTSLGYFIGAGFETDLGDSNWVLGGEIRYQGFRFDVAEYNMEGISGTKNYSYLSFMAKVGYKF